MILRITSSMESIKIDSDDNDISFSWLSNMSKYNRAGVGLHTSEGTDRKATLKMCRKIAKAVEEYLGWAKNP